MTLPGHFCVLDVETTGFSPSHHDRVLEVAAIRFDRNGRILDTFETLVNPDRDPGPTHIHGIRAAHLNGAPPFKNIVGHLTRMAKDSILVAHNWAFDRAFLANEFQRAGLHWPNVPAICTLWLARCRLPHMVSRRLDAICEVYDIPLVDAHSALSDATATGHLLFHLLGGDPTETEVATCVRGSSDAFEDWPELPCSATLLSRTAAAKKHSGSPPKVIERLLARLPVVGSPTPETEAYLHLLDDVLLDRRVTEDEADALADLADALGLSRGQVSEIHGDYVRAMVGVALTDGELSEAEVNDISAVAAVLCVPEDCIGALTPCAADELHLHESDSGSVGAAVNTMVGLSVCFTGELSGCVEGGRITRSEAESIAEKHGMVVHKRVTKSLDFLVMADVDSSSRKAKLARTYGTKIIAESAFWARLGVNYS